MPCKKCKSEVEEARRDFPGAAIDAADDNDVTSTLEKERTRTLDDNPRDQAGPDPQK